MFRDCQVLLLVEGGGSDLKITPSQAGPYLHVHVYCWKGGGSSSVGYGRVYTHALSYTVHVPVHQRHWTCILSLPTDLVEQSISRWNNNAVDCCHIKAPHDLPSMVLTLCTRNRLHVYYTGKGTGTCTCSSITILNLTNYMYMYSTHVLDH